MALTFPGTLPSDIKTIRGAGRIAYAPWLTGATDTGTFVYLGQVKDGGFQLDRKIETAEIEGEESLGPSDRYITRDTIKISCTLLEVPIATYALVFGAAAAAVTSDASTASMPLGGYYNTASDINPTFYQVALQHPNEYATAASPLATLKGYDLFWKCWITATGAQPIAKKSISELAIEITAHWDWSVTVSSSAAASVGRYGRKYVLKA